jgi:diguanylate cyclase (GGDEF)-like protein/PAS domain S-box-containing protein
MISHSDAITRTSSIMTAIVSLIIAVSIPVGYFITTYQYIKGKVNADCALCVQSIERVIVNNPHSWQFEEIRLQEILERIFRHDDPEMLTIKDMRGQIIAQTSTPLKNPTLVFSEPIFDSGAPAARIEIRRSISSLIAQTAIIGTCSVLLGILIFLLFRSFPLRTVRHAYRALEENEQRLQLAVASGNFGIWEWDIKKNAMIWDDRMYRIYGVSRDSVNAVFEAWQSRIHPDDRLRALADFRTAVRSEQKYDSEFRIVQPDGRVGDIRAGGVMIRDEDGNPLKMIGLHRDITEGKNAIKALEESEKRYRELSIVDGLSQLYNSRHFYFQLKIEIDRANRYEQPLTLLLLDLDDFKTFNDAYGHVEGDQVLRRVGQVVKRCLRETDFAYRYGGEEFTILLPMTTSMEGAVTAERIRTEFKKEVFSPVPDQEVHVTVSIGLAQYKPQEEMKAFVHRVDQLMYQGKKDGKDRICSESAPQEQFKW